MKDYRLRNNIIIASAAPFVFLGIAVLLVVKPNPWVNVPSAMVPVYMGFVSFAKVCSTMMKRTQVDSRDMAAFVLATFVMLASVIGGFAIMFRQFGLIGSQGRTDDPWTCLYFSAVTWTTVGYGDFSPEAWCRPFAAIEALTGYIFMAFLTATAVHLVTRFEGRPHTVSGSTLIGDPNEGSKGPE